MINHSSKIGYASGNLGKAVLWSSLDYFFLFILTELWNVSPVEAGLIVMIALVFDGLAAPLMGALADRTPPTFGKYGPYLALGAPLCGASFWFLLQPSGIDASFSTLLILSLCFRACYTICDVPHNALFARISSDARDASFISGVRLFFSSVGAVIVSVGAGWVLSVEEEPAQAARFGAFAMFAGGLYVLTIWWAWRATAPLDRMLPNTASRVSLSRAFGLVLRNRMILALFALATVHCLSVPIFTKGLAYFAKYVHGDAAWSSGALITIAILQGLSMPLWIWLSFKADKRSVLSLAYGLFFISVAAFFLAAQFAGVGIFAALVGVGIALGGLGMGLWSFLPDAIEAGVSDSGEKVEALPTGFFLLIIKCSTGLGAGLFGVMLNAIGLPTAQPGDAAFGQALTLVICALPVLGALVCAPFTLLVRRPDKVVRT